MAVNTKIDALSLTVDILIFSSYNAIYKYLALENAVFKLAFTWKIVNKQHKNAFRPWRILWECFGKVHAMKSYESAYSSNRFNKCTSGTCCVFLHHYHAFLSTLKYTLSLTFKLYKYSVDLFYLVFINYTLLIFHNLSLGIIYQRWKYNV